MLAVKPEIVRKVRELQIRTRRLLKGYSHGDVLQATKGYGLEFEQLADYQMGHDVRFIDWKSSARMNKLLVREYREERNRTIIVALDCSDSTLFGYQNAKKDLMVDVTTALCMAGIYQKDAVGLLLFTDVVEKYIKPKRSQQQLSIILRELCQVKPKSSKTSLKNAIEFLAKQSMKDALIVFVSDFIDTDFQKPLRALSKKHEIVAMRALDKYESLLPASGFVQTIDLEKQTPVTLNLMGKNVRKIENSLKEWRDQQEGSLRMCGIDMMNISDEKSVIDQLMRMFILRSRK